MIERPHWFSGIGTPLNDDDRADAAAILSARGHASGTSAVVVVAWPAAAAWAEHPAMAECWDDDEEEREVLWGRVAALIGEATLLAQLTAATTQAAPGVRAAALAASAASPATADQEVIATAAASALLALHQYRLAQLADVAPDHPFIRKHALFARGRWALGYRDGTYGIC